MHYFLLVGCSLPGFPQSLFTGTLSPRCLLTPLTCLSFCFLPLSDEFWLISASILWLTCILSAHCCVVWWLCAFFWSQRASQSKAMESCHRSRMESNLLPHAWYDTNSPSTCFSASLEGCTASEGVSDLVIQPDGILEMLSFHTTLSSSWLSCEGAMQGTSLSRTALGCWDTANSRETYCFWVPQQHISICICFSWSTIDIKMEVQ